jgi:hypothetical protein
MSESRVTRLAIFSLLGNFTLGSFSNIAEVIFCYFFRRSNWVGLGLHFGRSFHKLVRGTFLTSPLGANFDPRGEFSPHGEFCPLGVKFSVRPSILLNSRECSPLGVKEGVNISPRGQISPLGAKFNPLGEVIPWGPGLKLRMVLRSPWRHLPCGTKASFLNRFLRLQKSWRLGSSAEPGATVA